MTYSVPVTEAARGEATNAIRSATLERGLEVAAPLQIAPDRQDATHTVFAAMRGLACGSR